MTEKEISDSGLIEQFIKNPVAANLLMLIFFVGGFIVTGNLKSQVFPTVSPGIVQVTVPYPGATPAEVEESITRRVEEALLGIDGVKRISSTASENVGTITVELKSLADPTIVQDDVQTAVDGLAAFPPENAERAMIVTPKPSSGVVTLALTGNIPELELRRAAEQVERDLLSDPNISLVALGGARDYEISIEVSENDLRKYGLSFDEVAQAVQEGSVDLAGGSIMTDAGEILLRTNQKRQTGADFETIVVRTSNDGSKVLLSDVATVRDAFVRDKARNYYNGKPAIFVIVSKAEAEDVLRVKEAVDTYLSGAVLPDGVTLYQFADQTGILNERINLLARNALFGFALVFLFLVLMLDLKLAFWVCIGIATSFFGGAMFFGAMGVTITMISLFALIVVLGLVVDDAIVVGENIDSELASGKSGVQAALAGVKGVRSPVIVGVVTTMAAFAAMLISQGTFGDLVRSLPMVVISVLFVSLIEALFILPTHLSHPGTWSRGPLAQLQKFVGGTISSFSEGFIKNTVNFCSRFRYATVGTAIAFLIFCVGLMETNTVRFISFPVLEGNEISATIEMPVGAPFERTEAVVERLLAGLDKVVDELEQETGNEILVGVAASIGGQLPTSGGVEGDAGFTTAENIGSVSVELVPFGDQRSISAVEIERRWRDAVGEIEGADKVGFNSILGGFGADVHYELAHADDNVIIKASDELKLAMERIVGVSEIEDTFDLGKRQFVFELTDAGKAAGLTHAMLARQVRQAFFGEEVQRIQRGREELLVYVRYPKQARASLESLNQFRVRLPSGATAPLSTVARADESRAFSSINRIDGRRMVTVTADVDEDLRTPNQVNAQIVADVIPELEASYPGLKWEQGGGASESNEELLVLGQAFLVVLLIIYALVAAQLKSYLQPIAILASIPLGVGGAILGHLVLGYPVSMPSIFGIVALAGVAVNASVVLVDYYNKQRDSGLDHLESAAEASGRRFRPIMLTTLTTALGLAPLLLETSPQAKFLIPMGISLGFGILISSIMVIYVTPAIILIVEDIERLPERLLKFVQSMLSDRSESPRAD